MTKAPTTGVRALLAVSGFRNLWLGQLVSQVGDGVANFTLLILINQLTGSTTAVATMALALSVPQLVFGLVSGVLVDRGDRKRIMIQADLLRAVLVLGFLLVRRREDVWVFYAVGFVHASVGTLFDPAKAALLPALVSGPQLLAANSLSQTSGFAARVVGAGIAGVMVGFARTGWPAFCLDAITFLLSAAFVARISAPPRAGVGAGNGVRATARQLLDGLRLVARERMLVALMVVLAATSLALGADSVLAIPFLVNVLDVRTEALGLARAVEVIGMVLGAGLVTGLSGRLEPGRLMVAGVIGIGVLIALTGAAPSFAFALLATFAIGVCASPVEAAVATLTQTLVPDAMRGRTNSAMNTAFTAATVAAMAVAGTLGDAVGVRRVFYVVGAITVLAGIGAAWLVTKAPSRQAP